MQSNEKEQQKVWDEIAESWYHFRQQPQEQIALALKKLAKEWKSGKILDIGCGNCRNLIPFAFNDFSCFGVDFSNKMLEFSKQYITKHKMPVKLKEASATKLPFSNDYFDYILLISMLHHLNKKERILALKEAKRVLKGGGKLVIVVWNKLQLRFLFKKKDITIPWHVKGKKYERYYHIFTAWELKKLLQKEGFKILSKNNLGRNLIFVCEK